MLQIFARARTGWWGAAIFGLALGIAAVEAGAATVTFDPATVGASGSLGGESKTVTGSDGTSITLRGCGPTASTLFAATLPGSSESGTNVATVGIVDGFVTGGLGTASVLDGPRSEVLTVSFGTNVAISQITFTVLDRADDELILQGVIADPGTVSFATLGTATVSGMTYTYDALARSLKLKFTSLSLSTGTQAADAVVVSFANPLVLDFFAFSADHSGTIGGGAGLNSIVYTTRSAGPLTVSVDAASKQWDISPTLVGTHQVYSSIKDNVYADGSLAAWSKQVGVATSRYPGGTIVKYWDWENPTGNSGQTTDRWDPNFDGVEKPASDWMSLDEYLTYVTQSGIRPLFGVNSLSGTLYNREADGIARAVRMVEYVKTKGYGGALWYIGNEEEGMHSSAGGYAAVFKRYATAMKAVDPNIKICWNQNTPTTGSIQSFLNNDGGSADGFESHGKWAFGGTPTGFGDGTYDQWLTEIPLRDRKNFRAYRSAANSYRAAAAAVGRSGLKIADNEYGLGNYSGFGKFSIGMMLTEFLMEHFIGNWDSTCYWDMSAMIVAKTNGSYRINPIGLGMQLLADAQGGEYLGTIATTASGVHGFAARKDGVPIVYLFNKSGSTHTVNLQLTGTTATTATARRMEDTPADSGYGQLVSVPVTIQGSQGSQFSVDIPPMTFTEVIFASSLPVRRNLRVSSAYGSPTPGSVTTQVDGSLINASVNSPIITGSHTGFVATGWTGTGSVGSGTGNNASFNLTSDSTLTWQWQAVTINTITATTTGSGSISPGGASIVVQGSNQSYTITPAAHNHVVAVIVDGVNQGAISSYTFSNVTADHTIEATFAIDQHTLTVTSPYGTPSPSGLNTYDYGTPVTATVNSPVIISGTQYVATGWAGTGSVTSGTGTSANVTLTSNSTLNWQWQAAYPITASTSGSGSISPSGTTPVVQGGTQLYTFTPAANYFVSDVKIDGASVGAVSQYTFANVTAPHTVDVTFVYSPGLLDHTFDEGAGTLNGTPVDAGTLKAANPALAWVTDIGTAITANGTITASGLTRSAYIPLGTSIANGNIYELTVTLAKPSGTWVSAGFFDSATPTVTTHMDVAGAAGTGWFLWRYNGDVEANIGLRYDTNVGYDAFGAGPSFTHTVSSVTASSQSFTIRLDLSAANGTSNFGNMTVYQGDSSTGTVLGGLSNVAFTSTQHFRALGISALSANGSISRIKLTQVNPTISIAATDATAAEPGTDTGTFTITRSGVTSGTTTVDLTIYGTATSGSDYGALPSSVTFAGGETSKTLTVMPLSDTLVEGSETVIVTIAGGTGYAVDQANNTATVTIADLPPYDAWLSGFTFAQGADKTATGDPDGDGFANLVEYALGLNPTVANTNPITLSDVTVNGSTYLQLSVNRNPAVTNVLIEGQSTGDLSTPNSWSSSTTVNNPNNTASVFTVRDAVPISTAGKRFLRLRFTLLP